MEPALKCGYTSETPLRETNYSFMSNYRLEIDSWLEIGACVCFTIWVLAFHLAWACADPVHDITVSETSYISYTAAGRPQQSSLSVLRTLGLHIVQLWISIYFQVVQEETSLLKTKQHTDHICLCIRGGTRRFLLKKGRSSRIMSWMPAWTLSTRKRKAEWSRENCLCADGCWQKRLQDNRVRRQLN